jgi:hypothetical protein
MTHGNSHQNDKPHHLYEIRDKQEEDIFKYGISADPIEADGLSKRLRNQLNFMNLIAGWLRFFGNILIRDIPGRAEAEKLEREHIDAYRKIHGRNPKGNLK